MTPIRVIFTVSTLLLAGCVGALNEGAVERDIYNPSVSNGKGSIDYSGASKPTSANVLQEKWGHPDSIKTVGDAEEWTYTLDSQISNSTLLILGVIPIPINLPNESEKVIFTVKDDVVLKAMTRFEGSKGGVCGFHLGEHFGTEFGCTR